MQCNQMPEEKAFRDCNVDLQRGLTSPDLIATELYSADVLTFEQRDQVQNDMVPACTRTGKLLTFLGAQIQGNPAVFHTFVDVLKGEPAYSALVKKLVAAYQSKLIHLHVLCKCTCRLCKIHIHVYVSESSNSKDMY